MINNFENIFKIKANIEDVRDEINSIPKGKYLCVQANSNEVIYIPHEEFYKLVSKAKSKPMINMHEDIEIGLGGSALTEKSIIKPDFSDLMKFLVEKINIVFENDNDEMIISSSEGIILELPWEDVSDKKIIVFREVISNKRKSFEEKTNNLLFVVSHAVKHGGEILEPIKEKMDEEIKSIYSLIGSLKTQEMPTHFKLQNVLLSIHTTKDSFKNTQWEKYNYVHFIMHGLDTGEICLENSDDHELVDPLSASDFLSILNGKNFELFFLSFCYSCGGVNTGESLAFKIIDEGISKYVIGYSYPVKGGPALLFATDFYDRFLNGDKDIQGNDRIKDFYKKSLLKCYNKNNIRNYVPFLYMYT